MTIPPEAITAAADAMIADYPVKAETLRSLAVTALEAAAPLLVEQGAAAERQRIRQLAIQMDARCAVFDKINEGGKSRPFADLLGGDQ